MRRCVLRNSHNELAIRSKLRIEIDGEPVFGRGGGAALTGEARTFIKKFSNLDRDIRETVNDAFSRIYR